jgi:uncharacterized protein (DUF2236 family)
MKPISLAGTKTNHEHGPRDGFFSPDSVFWRVSREMVAVGAGGRALLMQLAHPKVAAGVAQHSRFPEDSLTRLRRTMNSTWSITFDERAAALASLQRIQGVHAKVKGLIAADEISLGDSRYSALDPELLLWVHATLIDAGMVAYTTFVSPLSMEEARQYYDESKLFARLFEIPESLIPPSLPEFREYVNGMIAGPEISVGSAARRLAQDILHPRPWLLKPGGPMFRLITAGLLPPRLRAGYGIAWSDARSRRFEFAARLIRLLRPRVPAPLRIVPQARAAEKRLGRKVVE